MYDSSVHSYNAGYTEEMGNGSITKIIPLLFSSTISFGGFCFRSSVFRPKRYSGVQTRNLKDSCRIVIHKALGA